MFRIDFPPLLAWVCLLGPWGPGGPTCLHNPVHAQRDSAATEAEWGKPDMDALRGDPHRDPDLACLSPMDGMLHGAEHIAPFLAGWRNLLEGTGGQNNFPLQVMQFGGSHVQAGRIGWSFRNRLQEDRPGLVLGRGIQPPHRLVRTNGPPERGWSSPFEWQGQSCANRRHSGEWGLTGLEACGPDSARLTCWTGSPAGEQCCSLLRILAPPAHASAWNPLLPEGWSMEGASAERTGVATWAGPAGTDDTLLLVSDSPEPSRLHGVEWVPHGVDFVYHDLGANGANSTSWMRNPHFSAQLSAIAPDLVILAWGINDAYMAPSRFDPARFSEHYQAVIDTIRSALPDAGILLVTNNDSHYRHHHNPNAERVRQVMLGLVDTHGVACWDLYHHLGGAGSVDLLHEKGFAAQDRLHMQRDGYILFGELLYETLVRASRTVMQSGS